LSRFAYGKKGSPNQAKTQTSIPIVENKSFGSMAELPASVVQRNDNRIDVPTTVDVLLGRGKPFQSHPGNQRMLRIIDEHRTRYLQADRSDKHDIIVEIIGAIRGSGGRFLRRVDYEHYWIEVSQSIAYRKVGHAFRSKARTNISETSTETMSPSVSREGGFMIGFNRVPSALPGRALLGERGGFSVGNGASSSLTARQLQSLLNAALVVNSTVPYPREMRPPAIGLWPELSLSGMLAPTPPLRERTTLLYHWHLLGVPRGVIGGIVSAPSGIALENALARSRMIESLSSHRGQINEALLHAGRRGTRDPFNEKWRNPECTTFEN
jgi:hypothetical protein